MVKCRKCGFEDHLEDAIYCQGCGTNLTNYCTDTNCDPGYTDEYGIPYEADYCPYCGSPASLNTKDSDE